MRSTISKSGGNASLARAVGKVWRSLNGHEGESRTQAKVDLKPFESLCSGGQGVCREAESEGHAENYRAVVDGGDPETNRSAEGGARSSLLYGGEGVTHPPTRFKVIAGGTVGKNNT
jgi:hypothetical protein